jgi:hypothetical protein
VGTSIGFASEVILLTSYICGFSIQLGTNLVIAMLKCKYRRALLLLSVQHIKYLGPKIFLTWATWLASPSLEKNFTAICRWCQPSLRACGRWPHNFKAGVLSSYFLGDPSIWSWHACIAFPPQMQVKTTLFLCCDKQLILCSVAGRYEDILFKGKIKL